MPAPSTPTRLDSALNVEHRVDEPIRCRRCQTEVTRHELAVHRAGGHEHTFRNPAGYSWRIACFADAPGCGATGEPTTDASWFAGYAWSYSHCGSCNRHLGWWFVDTGSSFVGLITTRLNGVA